AVCGIPPRPAHADLPRRRLPGDEEHGERSAHPPQHADAADLVRRPLALPVGLFDRRQLVEVSLDARGELFCLGPEQLQLALALRAFAPLPCLATEPRRNPRPLSAEYRRDGADQQGDHEPAHATILPAVGRGQRWGGWGETRER